MKRLESNTLMAFIWNMAMAYIVYFLCRVEFVLENWSLYKDTLFQNSLSDLFTGSLIFDTSAILYSNALYALLMLLPLHYKETAIWQKVAKWVFIIANSLVVVLNLGDSVYVKYTGRRTTISVMQEFHNENNLGGIFGTEILNHWYLFIFGALLIYGMWKLYRKTPSATWHLPHNGEEGKESLLKYYVVQIIAFVVYIPLTIGGMRGGFSTAVRPITISNANQYVNHPNEAAVILNTPFSIIRTFDKQTFEDPHYYTQKELDFFYSPVRNASLRNAMLRKRKTKTRGCNVVILIVESFGREYIEEGLAPEVSKLMKKSLTFKYSFSNGRKSIDGMPSILSSIPMFVEPFFLTPSSMNNVSGIAGELDKDGYETAFFHGAENGSMGFEAFARTSGFKYYYGRSEYDRDLGSAQGKRDFDGMWAIWDEPFLQYYAKTMSKLKQPFMTAVFTASSHHPFKIPKEFKAKVKGLKAKGEEEKNPIHKCIRYTDHAIGEFFRTASKQPWFNNTIFVITNDHTNIPDGGAYKTDLGVFRSPIIIYDPSGEIKPGQRDCIAQQIDIMPTILGYLGYNRPYIAFGQNLFETKDEDTWAVNYENGMYQFVKGLYVLQFDSQRVKAVYNYRKDPLLKHNLKGKVKEQAQMERQLKAIIQSYMQRMINNRLTYPSPPEGRGIKH